MSFAFRNYRWSITCAEVQMVVFFSFLGELEAIGKMEES